MEIRPGTFSHPNHHLLPSTQRTLGYSCADDTMDTAAAASRPRSIDCSEGRDRTHAPAPACSGGVIFGHGKKMAVDRGLLRVFVYLETFDACRGLQCIAARRQPINKSNGFRRPMGGRTGSRASCSSLVPSDLDGGAVAGLAVKGSVWCCCGCHRSIQ